LLDNWFDPIVNPAMLPDDAVTVPVIFALEAIRFPAASTWNCPDDPIKMLEPEINPPVIFAEPNPVIPDEVIDQ
jgi:hypothetical protein